MQPAIVLLVVFLNPTFIYARRATSAFDYQFGNRAAKAERSLEKAQPLKDGSPNRSVSVNSPDSLTTLKSDSSAINKTNHTAKPDPIVTSISEKFSRGALIVHMKRDFEDSGVADFERWMRQAKVDPGLSFSLIHPQMAEEKLWMKSGFLFDADKCQPLAGSRGDMWVNNEFQQGAERILATPEGQRAELLRLMWLRHAKRKGAWLHVVLPPDFRKWVTEPEKWSERERQIITMKNPFQEEETITELPGADELRSMLADIDARRHGILFEATDFMSLAEAVVRDYSVAPTTRFSEVLSFCPLHAIQGYVYSIQDMPEGYLETFRPQKLQEGREVLEAMRRAMPTLNDQTLVITEYAPTPDVDLESKVVLPLANSTVKRHEGQKFIQWKDDFQAQLHVIEISTAVGVLKNPKTGKTTTLKSIPTTLQSVFVAFGLLGVASCCCAIAKVGTAADAD